MEKQLQAWALLFLNQNISHLGRFENLKHVFKLMSRKSTHLYNGRSPAGIMMVT